MQLSTILVVVSLPPWLRFINRTALPPSIELEKTLLARLDMPEMRIEETVDAQICVVPISCTCVQSSRLCLHQLKRVTLRDEGYDVG